MRASFVVATLMVPLLLTATPLAAQRRPTPRPTPPKTATPAAPQGPPTLVLGSTMEGQLGPAGESAKYNVTVTAAGLLTVAAEAGADIGIAVSDADGQTVREGQVDMDYRGNTGAEYVTVPLPRGGTYVVEVRSVGEGTSTGFTVTAGFVPMKAVELPEDPDGRPSAARTVKAGDVIEDAVNAESGDLADWFTVTATQAMTLVIVTRVGDEEEGDLVIEAYNADNLSEHIGRSDQDLRDRKGNESVTLELRAGETIKFKVLALSETSAAIPYRLSIGQVP